jgi:hypothetical protein
VAGGTGQVTVSLGGLSADLDVLVLDGQTGCQPGNCLTWGDNNTAFQALAGRTYYSR